VAETADARVQFVVVVVVVAEKKRAVNVRYHYFEGGLVLGVRVGVMVRGLRQQIRHSERLTLTAIGVGRHLRQKKVLQLMQPQNCEVSGSERHVGFAEHWGKCL